MQPFIKLNCGAIPENLIESELFGHEKGAFTGASCSKKGYFERANGGTLFLDEIGEMPHCCQVKLLRVLQNKEAYRVGGEKSFEINTRIVAATNRNLEEMVKRGEFREDLWYRLNVYLINIPPLKERVEDIPELVHFFVNKISNEMEMAAPPILKVAFGVFQDSCRLNC
ncbi:sigma 54-interacting transcriptional regulator [Shewanella phaeophyticola]|uniref:Sigma 54-interacting transcriptional regulator n=1 Tax=Shewanella phaeophyticola TaxID=2978345 RepID=A0ABT2P880_9GAMM|nr:sigma 54-interacting transcriptional regulator [Shewanella sp. KJ10-1]MCT8987640.1 sigma 54-interacting transcriptional regulator [Shewanella sp. KJ10-1]